MRWPKLSKRLYANKLDKRIFAYYRLVGWYNLQMHLGERLYSLIIPAKTKPQLKMFIGTGKFDWNSRAK